MPGIPVSVGWQFSTLMLLPNDPSSWVGILDQQRIGSEQTAIDVGIAQLRAVLPLISRRVIVLADRWYAVARFVCACRDLNCSALIRLKRNRKLYRPVPPRKKNQRGAPRKHGPLFQGTRPETYGVADAEWEGSDEQGKRIVVSCWKHLHFHEAPQAEVCVIRVQREAASGSKRDPRESWFIWTGSPEVSLEDVRPWYRKRFSQEHGYRFLKQDLLWDKAHLRTPEQVERWSWHTRSAAQTSRKSTGLAKRTTTNTSTTLCGGAQTETDAQIAPQTGLKVSPSLSYIIHSDSLDHSVEMSASLVCLNVVASKQ